MGVRSKIVVSTMSIIWLFINVFYYSNPYDYQIHLVDIEDMYSSIVLVILFSIFIVYFAKRDKYRVLQYFLIIGMLSGLVTNVFIFFELPNVFNLVLYWTFLVPFFGFNYLTETSWDLIFFVPSIPYVYFLLLYIATCGRRLYHVDDTSSGVSSVRDKF